MAQEDQILSKLSEIQVSLARLETHSESTLKDQEDHEKRLRTLESRKGLWNVLSGIVGAATLYLISLFKEH